MPRDEVFVLAFAGAGSADTRSHVDCWGGNLGDRKNDTGEEFAVCMPAIKIQQAKDLAARLCVALADAKLATLVGPVNATVSIGVASFILGDNAEALIARADAAMYAAKRAGRNRVRVAYTGGLGD